MAPRAPLKQLGRPSALDALRARCLSRARENREMRLQSKRTELNVLEQPMATEHGLLAKLRGVLQEVREMECVVLAAAMVGGIVFCLLMLPPSLCCPD